MIFLLANFSFHFLSFFFPPPGTPSTSDLDLDLHCIALRSNLR